MKVIWTIMYICNMYHILLYNYTAPRYLFPSNDVALPPVFGCPTPKDIVCYKGPFKWLHIPKQLVAQCDTCFDVSEGSKREQTRMCVYTVHAQTAYGKSTCTKTVLWIYYLFYLIFIKVQKYYWPPKLAAACQTLRGIVIRADKEISVN